MNNLKLLSLVIKLYFCVFCSFLTIQSSLAQSSNQQSPPKILFIYPVDKGFPFWDSQVNFAQAVSDALNFDLEIAYTPEEYRNRFGAAAYIKEILATKKELPDLIITSFWVGSEKKILTLLDSKKVPLISINSDISDNQFSTLGRPREIYPYWLAHLSPNDTLAGSKLTKNLINLSRQKRCPNTQCRVNLFAITGASYSAVSNQRVKGLKQILKQDNQSRLLNVVFGNWDRKRVAGMAKTIFSRHNDIHAFWIASDVMAYGLEDGIKTQGIQLPGNTIIGGIDWSPPSIQKIEQGSMQLSLGGHFLEAGLSLILFYDYINNTDFKDDIDVVIKTEMSILDRNNVQQLGPFLSRPKWSISRLRSYSKFLNPARTQYNFNPKRIILEQFDSQLKPALSEN